MGINCQFHDVDKKDAVARTNRYMEYKNKFLVDTVKLAVYNNNMTKESILVKHKTHTKKSNSSSSADFETFLKNQQNIVLRLKTELKTVIHKVQISENGTVEKDKLILQLEQSINQLEAEVHKLNNNLEQFKEENNRILMEFNFFKEKFYQLETDYDKTLNLHYQENESLRIQIQQEQTHKNQAVQHLSMQCQDLQKRLQDNVEAMLSFEQMQLNFEQQRKEFEIYKNQTVEEKKFEDEKRKLDFETLTNEIKQKDETLNKCIADKNALEIEKNLVIDELNNKIFRIERAFSQPTKVVQPMVTLPQQNNSDISEVYLWLTRSYPPKGFKCRNSSNENVAISLPLVRKTLEEQTLQKLNKENQNVEQNHNQRNYKFKRPLQPTTSSSQSNIQTNMGPQRKRRNQSRLSTAKKNYNELSLSSSDEDNDNDNSYNNFSHQLWRPNDNNCYVADTDASEGFVKNKRVKK